MKVNLIFPCPIDSASNRIYANSLGNNIIRLLFSLGGSQSTPPLSLLMLAAVTPRDIDIRLVDERFEEIDFDEEVDLVGITVVTRTSLRAYEIADEYRKRGVVVVLGGIHPSVFPQEASLHADAVVIGEGERIWPQILEDNRQGQLKNIYTRGHIIDINELPFPRYDIISHPEWYSTTKPIYASRGCENYCTFCSAGLAIRKRYRTRHIQSIVDELSATNSKMVLFSDDNLGWDIDYAKELFRAIVPLNIKWLGGTTLSSLEDMELVDLFAKSGCVVLNLGFESLSSKVINSIKKNHINDPSRYRELIRRVHSCGITIFGSFILGFDDDDPSVFREMIDFINETNIDLPVILCLIPYPGSEIYRQFEREQRLLHKNWNYYDSAAAYVVYQPKQMTPQELQDGYLMVIEELHTIGSSLRRLARAKTLFSFGALPAISYNLQKRRSVREETPRMKESLRLP